MKNAIFTITMALMILGCTHVITRTGYKANPGVKNDTCQVRMFRCENNNTTTGKVIGKVKAGDSGYSFACSEYDAIELFKKEACNANADVVNIIEEQRPDSLSSCYRATALLIRTDSSQIPIPDTLVRHQTQIDIASMEKRSKEDRHKNIRDAVLLGILGSLLVSTAVSLINIYRSGEIR